MGITLDGKWKIKPLARAYSYLRIDNSGGVRIQRLTSAGDAADVPIFLPGGPDAVFTLTHTDLDTDPSKALSASEGDGGGYEASG